MFLCDAEYLLNSEILIKVAVIQHHINAALIFLRGMSFTARG